MKKHYGGLQSEQVQELKQLTEENARLKKLVADFSLDKSALQDVLSKKIPRPALMKSVVDYVTAYHGYSERKACALTRQHRSAQRSASQASEIHACCLGSGRTRSHRHASGMAIDVCTLCSDVKSGISVEISSIGFIARKC